MASTFKMAAPIQVMQVQTHDTFGHNIVFFHDNVSYSSSKNVCFSMTTVCI